jgi:hypothetical protein
MRYILATITTIALASVPANDAIAQDAAVFTPSSAWALDYGDDYCRLMRDFSDGDDTIGLFIERTQPGPFVRLIVIGDGVRLFRGAEQIGYRMNPGGAPRTVQKLRFLTGDGQQYLNLGPTTLADAPTPAPGAPPSFPARYTPEGETAAAAQITGLTLDAGLTSPVRIETGSLGSAATALQACADDLLASWGLDPELHKGLTRPAMPSAPTAGWIAADTIPFADFAKLSGGNNELRVIVDAQGQPQSCAVQFPALDAAINQRVCAAVMEKAAFAPALDAAGQPMASYWTSSVFFLLPPFGG